MEDDLIFQNKEILDPIQEGKHFLPVDLAAIAFKTKFPDFLFFTFSIVYFLAVLTLYLCPILRLVFPRFFESLF
jgi:hypothetical protein